jgi:hypothetical protein
MKPKTNKPLPTREEAMRGLSVFLAWWQELGRIVTSDEFANELEYKTEGQIRRIMKAKFKSFWEDKSETK